MTTSVTSAAPNPVATVQERAGSSSAPAAETSAEQTDWAVRGRAAVMRIPVPVRFVLGGAKMPVSKLLSLAKGAVIPLDRKIGDLVDVVVNDKIIARGEIIVLDEKTERFAVVIRELPPAEGS